MVSLASDLSAVHVKSLLRKRDAKTCRGDVSEKFRCAATRHPTRSLGLSLTMSFSFHLKAKERLKYKSNGRMVL
jgi:hypothetical protein